jgi:hypothetical protein
MKTTLQYPLSETSFPASAQAYITIFEFQRYPNISL